MTDVVRVRYVDGQAQVDAGGQKLAVARRDDDERIDRCPLEWLSVALGS
jgi:hypothetical protein